MKPLTCRPLPSDVGITAACSSAVAASAAKSATEAAKSGVKQRISKVKQARYSFSNLGSFKTPFIKYVITDMEDRLLVSYSPLTSDMHNAAVGYACMLNSAWPTAALLQCSPFFSRRCEDHAHIYF